MGGRGSGSWDRWLFVETGENLITKMPDGSDFRQWLMEQWLRVRDKQGRLVPLSLNEAQREFEKKYGRKNIILKARQLGITTYVAARFFLDTILRPGTLTVQVAHDQPAAEQIFRVVHRYLENLPDDVRRGVRTSRSNVRQIVFPEIDSEYRVESAADENAGRGLTIQRLHCSEVSRWPGDAAETLAALRAAVPPDGEVVLESTPAGAWGAFYDEWQRAGETGYVRHFFPWWLDASYRRNAVDADALTEEERELQSRQGLDLEQIAFRREMKSNFGVRAKEEFAEDAETCFAASGECAFDLKAIEARMAELGEPISVRDNGRLLLWWPAVRGREYVIGVDPAGGGVDGDFACAQVLDAATGLQCAELLGHYTPQELARKLVEVGREYNEALIAVERNNHGHAVLAHLAHMEYERVYESGADARREAGWLTTTASRPRMIEGLASALQNEVDKFYSRRLLAECRTFVRRENGSAAAAAGTHDDAVMAMALAWAVRAEVQRTR